MNPSVSGGAANIPKRVLIYRLGSIGDTIVALPALKLVARAFPDAERWMLTNFSVSSKAAPIAQIVEGMGLIDGYLEYPIGTRRIRALSDLRRQIHAFSPDILVYLAEPRGKFRALRDAAFFWSSGVRRLIGLPLRSDQQSPLKLSTEKYEYEGARLARCIAALGDVRLDNPDSFDLLLGEKERAGADQALEGIHLQYPLLIASVGAKTDVKDWGDENWQGLLRKLCVRLPGWALIMLGADDERQRTAGLLKNWTGPKVNLCGTLNVRESAAVMSRARLFIGHDSGPMHMAAAQCVPCVAIFSSQNLPGEWFPFGERHRVLYTPIECQGCRLQTCVDRNKLCIRSITVEAVVDAALEVAARKQLTKYQ